MIVWDTRSGDRLATVVPSADGWSVFTPDGRFKRDGDTRDTFWYAINLCRFEPEEAADLFPEHVREVPLDEPLLLPPA